MLILDLLDFENNKNREVLSIFSCDIRKSHIENVFCSENTSSGCYITGVFIQIFITYKIVNNYTHESKVQAKVNSISYNHAYYLEYPVKGELTSNNLFHIHSHPSYTAMNTVITLRSNVKLLRHDILIC